MDVVFGTSSKGKQTHLSYLSHAWTLGTITLSTLNHMRTLCEQCFFLSEWCHLSQRDIWELSEQYTLLSFCAEFLASYIDQSINQSINQAFLLNVTILTNAHRTMWSLKYKVVINFNVYTVFVLLHSYARWSVARLSVARLIVAAINCRRD